MACRGLGAAMWFAGLYKVVLESDSFSSLPHSALERGLDTAMFSTWDVAARLGTLNMIIPSLSDVA